MGGGDSEEEGDGDGEAPHGETKLREPWWGVWSDSSDQPDLSLLLLPCQPFHGDVKTPGYFLEAGLPSTQSMGFPHFYVGKRNAEDRK